jgi:iron complex transport system ATP-binding protein
VNATAPDSPAIRAERVGWSWRRLPWLRPRPALIDVSLEVARRSLHLLAGANGAGKSTLLRLMAGVVAPSSGTLKWFGGEEDGAALRGRVAWLPEASGAEWAATIEELVSLAAALYGGSREARGDRVETALAEVDLVALRRRRWSTLSKGERRRAATAQVLATGAELLLLDEPLDGVDPESAERLLERLAARARAGSTIVLSSHVLLDGAIGGDALTVLAGGRVVASGPPAALLRDSRGERRTFAELLRQARGGA